MKSDIADVITTHTVSKNMTPITCIEMNGGTVLISVPEHVVPFFKELLIRGEAAWEKAPIEIKAFVSRWALDLDLGQTVMNTHYKTCQELANVRTQGAAEN